MFDVVFPENTGLKYYDTHFKYILNIFEYLNCSISFEKRDAFIVDINNKKVLFDFADSNVNLSCTIPTFKFHCVKDDNNISCFTPVSFYDWNEYYKLSNEIEYKAQGYITFRQRPYAESKTRRNKVKTILSLTTDVETKILPQEFYWEDINNCLVAIFVPGAYNNMLDRGQLQYMALGCCTISPEIPELLPFNRKLVENIHYIKCKNDYSDLLDKIEFCKKNKDLCLEIGNHAKNLFQKTSTPERLGDWINMRLF